MKKMFLTGGSGTVGEAVIKELHGQYEFYSYSRNEKMQVALKRNYEDVNIILGAVEDKVTLQQSIMKVKPDVVIHAAALKHVDSAEKAPIAAIKSNIVGSLNVIEACLAANVPITVAISTDKACQPDSNYGQTKALMEKMFLEAHSPERKFNVCRFGNVSHSHGSVIPYWLRLKEAGKALPLTDKKMNRLIISREGAAKLVAAAVEQSQKDEEPFVLTKKMKAVNMFELAKTISPDIEIIGLRAGEKLNERLISDVELKYTHCENDFVYIRLHENNGDSTLDESYASNTAEFMNPSELIQLVEDTSSGMEQSLLRSKIY